MNKPPEKIDNADVILWAWSGGQPFGIVFESDGSEAAKIFGLAICKYEDSDAIYRFSCDKSWGTVQDGIYNSVSEAKEQVTEQYKNVSVVWTEFE